MKVCPVVSLSLFGVALYLVLAIAMGESDGIVGEFPTWFIPLSCLLGIVVAIFLWATVGKVKVGEIEEDDQDDALL